MYKIVNKGRTIYVKDLKVLKSPEKNFISGTTTPGLTVKTKIPTIEVAEMQSNLVLNWQNVTLPVGTVIGKTTGVTGTGSALVWFYGYTVVKLSVNLSDRFKAGQEVAILSYQIDTVAGQIAEGSGFPFGTGDVGENVKILQQYILSCLPGSLGQYGADGKWGNLTETARIKLNIPNKITSKQELDSIVNRLCTVSTGGTGDNGTGGTGVIVPPVKDETQNQDNTNMILIGIGALAIGYKLLKPKKPTRKKRRR